MNFIVAKQLTPQKIIEKRFQVKGTDIKMVTDKKAQLSVLNGQRFQFYDGIISLPFGHPLLEKVKKETKGFEKKH